MANLNPENIDVTKVLIDLNNVLKTWNWMATVYKGLLMFFGVASIASSLFVATFSEELTPLGRKIILYISALSLALISYFGIATLGNNARKAWRILNAAMFQYKSGEVSITELIAAYEKGEETVGELNFTYQIPQK